MVWFLDSKLDEKSYHVSKLFVLFLVNESILPIFGTYTSSGNENNIVYLAVKRLFTLTILKREGNDII